ncbi:hypothetical protein [Desulfovibrio cuneatus]|uniref:hypothetical protein n=1 Tax=Desulfovibrio cuneatus TaxID=159728 RepID=UPI000426D4C2|nr:hypothetical protein [Desulfovibrio cuneatus]
MQPTGKLRELFQAYSRINGTAFRNPHLVCCPTLSKAPNYGNVVRRFVEGSVLPPMNATAWTRLWLRYAATNLGHLLFLLAAKVWVGLLGWAMPKALLKKHGAQRLLLVIDTFALLPQIAREKRYQEMYLTGVWEAAHAAGYTPVRLFRLYGSRSPRVLWQALAVLSQSGAGLTEVHLLRLRDFAALVWHLCVYPFALCGLIRSLRNSPPGTPEQAIHDALIASAGQCVLVGEAYRLAAFRLGGLLARVGKNQATAPKVLSWYENQTLNKAFLYGLRSAQQHGPRTIVIGAQLFTWPAALLNNHADDTEAALGLAPDVVAVTGPEFLPEGSCQHYVVGPALRYRHLFMPLAVPAKEGAARATAETDDEKPLLALLSYHPEETRRVLELVRPLAASPGKVAYKFHPATKAADYAGLLPPAPSLVTTPLAEALAGASGVIGAGSGALAEAVSLGCPVLAARTPGEDADMGLNYLPNFGEGKLWATVETPEAVAPALAELRTFQHSHEYAAAKAAFTALLFTEPTPQSIKALLALGPAPTRP